MTLPYQDDRIPQPVGTPTGNSQDVVPQGERDQDELREAITQDLTSGESRPLTQDEQEAAEHDVGRGERVYAPASERVPKPPVPGHRDLVEQADTDTPERQAIGWSPDAPASQPRRQVRIPNGSSRREEGRLRNQQLLGVGLAWLGVFVCGAVGTWLFSRWRAERSRPINRLRRQARRAATELRDRVPETAEAPSAMGVSAAALVTTALFLARRMRRSEPDVRDRAEQLRTAGWQKQLTALRERWVPRKMELEVSGKVER